MKRNCVSPAISSEVGEWLQKSLDRSGDVVGSFVPPTYPAFARAMNPFYIESQPLRWGGLAEKLGIKPDGNLNGEEIRRFALERLGIELSLDIGTIDVHVAGALTETLAEFTSTPADCFFGVWPGYEDAALDLSSAPVVVLPPARELYLFQGPLGCATEPIGLPPENRRFLRWWPADHAWCVGNDLYGDSVYIGGSSQCIEAVMRNSVLESFTVEPTDPIQRIENPSRRGSLLRSILKSMVGPIVKR